MSNSTECCCGNDENRALPAPQDGLSITSGADSCYSVHAVGGLSDIRAIASSENAAKQPHVHLIADFPPASGPDESRHVPAPNHLCSDSSPPPVGDVYLLSHSLLI